MELLKLFTFIVMFMFMIMPGNAKTKLHQKTGLRQHNKKMRIHARGLPPNCRVVCDVNNSTNQNEPQDSSEDYDDAGDNETAVEMTSLPPGYYNDVYLNNEDGGDDDVRLDPANPLVDFIVIKHRYSNETNQAFPPYAFAGRNKKGKQTRNKKKEPSKQQHRKENRKHWSKRTKQERKNHKSFD